MTEEKKVEVTAIVPVSPMAVVAMGPNITHAFDYEGDTGTFKLFHIDGEALLETELYRLAICENPSGQIGVAMVSTSEENNWAVDKQIRVANTLQGVAATLDEEAEKPTYHGALFPTALETFDADGRLGVFLGYHPVIQSYQQLVPMSLVLENDRVDLKSAAWMLGKLMKLLTFLHDLDFALNFLDDSNVFLELAQHGVFTFDLSAVNELPSEVDKADDVVSAAKLIWWAAGGNEEGLPYDEAIMSPEDHGKFKFLLETMMLGGMTAREVHTAAYEMFDQIWPKQPGGTTGGLKRDWHLWQVYPR